MTSKEIEKHVERAKTIEEFFNDQGIQQELAKTLGKAIDPVRYLRVALTTIVTNRKLLACTEVSLFNALLTSAQLGLDLDERGLAYLIPYGSQAQFQIGYKGLIELARRSGHVYTVNPYVVYSEEKIKVEYGTNESIVHSPLEPGKRGGMVAAYAVAEMAHGKKFCFMWAEEIHKRRNKSRAYQYAEKGEKDSTWHEWPDEMWKKTTIRELAKTLPQCEQMHRAAAIDEAIDFGIIDSHAPPVTSGKILELQLTGGDLHDVSSKSEKESVPPGKGDSGPQEAADAPKDKTKGGSAGEEKKPRRKSVIALRGELNVLVAKYQLGAGIEYQEALDDAVQRAGVNINKMDDPDELEAAIARCRGLILND